MWCLNDAHAACVTGRSVLPLGSQHCQQRSVLPAGSHHCSTHCSNSHCVETPKFVLTSKTYAMCCHDCSFLSHRIDVLACSNLTGKVPSSWRGGLYVCRVVVFWVNFELNSKMLLFLCIRDIILHHLHVIPHVNQQYFSCRYGQLLRSYIVACVIIIEL